MEICHTNLLPYNNSMQGLSFEVCSRFCQYLTLNRCAKHSTQAAFGLMNGNSQGNNISNQRGVISSLSRNTGATMVLFWWRHDFKFWWEGTKTAVHDKQQFQSTYIKKGAIILPYYRIVDNQEQPPLCKQLKVEWSRLLIATLSEHPLQEKWCHFRPTDATIKIRSILENQNATTHMAHRKKTIK